jgi:molecular chaperone GrpE
VIRDKRRIDPDTGEVREPQRAAAPAPATGAAPPVSPPPEVEVEAVVELEKALAERTADLQRLQAEYLNYKRRVDRDRELAKETTTASVLAALLPVLDDIGRAREHGELVGGFKAVAESFERIVSGLGLEAFGAEGDEFDPRVHEALMHSYDDEVDGPVAKAVLQVGYRLGDRVVRPARVAVAEPTDPTDVPETAEAADAPADDGAQSPATDATGRDADEGSDEER